MVKIGRINVQVGSLWVMLIFCLPIITYGQSNKTKLTEQAVNNIVHQWYQGTNDHIPVEELELLLSEDVKMTYPNTKDTLVGKQAFREWYADVLSKYFDETHVVESSEINIKDNTATAHVLVRWETRAWEKGQAKSTYRAYLSNQRFIIRKDASGKTLITEKHALSFDETAPLYGPLQTSNSRIPPEGALHPM